MSQEVRALKITQFAAIDGAMMKVIRTAAAYEQVIYTAGERAALDNVVKAALNLKHVFEKVEAQVNERYATKVKQEQENRQGVRQ